MPEVISYIEYAYSGMQEIGEYEDLDADTYCDDLTRKFIDGPGIDEPIAMIVASGANAGMYWYHFDALGSVIALSQYNTGNGYASIVEWYAYSAFGQTTILAPNYELRTASLFGNPYMFTGRRLDVETRSGTFSGLYYYRARIYSPDLGRFLQPDPIGYSDGLNMYAYCRNNPINFVDPSGLIINVVGDEDAFKIAIRYLVGRSDRAMQTYKMLVRSPITYTINVVNKNQPESESGSVYLPEEGIKTIVWYSRYAMKHDNGSNSPAFVLAHEMEHVRCYIEGMEQIYYAEEEAKRRGFGTSQDEYIIKNIEGILAKQLGEDLRPDHNVNSFYKTKCPAGRDPLTLKDHILDFFGLLY